ncbi:hypothetical protein AAFF_G00101030 [Aldrovandia affinis]|uniref:Uncharacterized protein n=1 Tax=Aldrovandia affinis TaxID=143900 RepID=A0AAD7RV38_9TELE|nr:hypothetical protein AAFF_G00101030 [Aldrovandia affinis]
MLSGIIPEGDSSVILTLIPATETTSLPSYTKERSTSDLVLEAESQVPGHSVTSKRAPKSPVQTHPSQKVRTDKVFKRQETVEEMACTLKQINNHLADVSTSL